MSFSNKESIEKSAGLQESSHELSSEAATLTDDLRYLQDTDDAYNKKMNLINSALSEIGFTKFHLILFCLAGFGYAADSQISMVQSACQTYAVYYQYNFSYPISTTFCYAGLFAGAIVIGFSADIIGRKTAFNFSLLLASLFGFMAGGSSSLPMYLLNMFLSNFFLGGNLALDVTLLLEYLPFKYQFLNTFLACFWGVGQTICELVAWAFLPNYSCEGKLNCPMHENRGWRYCWYVNSGIVLGFALIRIFLFDFQETPKHLISAKRDEEAVVVLQDIAKKYNRKCSLTIQQLKECGEIHIDSDFFENPSMLESLKQAKGHVKMLFMNKTATRSNILIIISWFGIGITYGIYNNFLYAFLASHGAKTGSTPFQIYRDATLGCFFSIFGPPIAALLMFYFPNALGRRGVMAIGGISSMICLMCYTKVRTEAANVVVSSLSYILINMYYGTLYAYTPEVMVSASRATGSALALSANRIAGLIVPVIYYFSNTSGSAVPIYVCGAIIGVIGVLALLMPFEPSKSRSV